MDEYYVNLNQAMLNISDELEITNLVGIQNHYDDNCYWPRLARLSFFNKLYDAYGYHFLYEIQALSSQIHFGIASCFLFRDKISTVSGRPNVYNHRYTFMIESSIHSIYSYWNRVGLVLNTYLKKPKVLKNTYFANVVDQLLVDYPILQNNANYNWLLLVKVALNELDRNEFAHNNSLIMQAFLPKNHERDDFKNLLAMPDLLLSHNKSIVDEIFNLVQLVEDLEAIIAT
ncbi:hypothetical protein [Sphingobacterium sp. UBA5980]|uniref:hypothetical protein n=1 Tax=Sphingobacterium sp. UBA5980 TaxID=1947504 RepID=UPI00257E8820|nr:hypothetical protein [Sphingobacterium sp. UBA5980]